MKTYTCEKCGKAVEEFVGPLQQFEEARIIATDYPEFDRDPGMADFFRKLSAERGETPKPVQLYHRTYVWTKGYGCACCGGYKPTLCGPLHEETQEEYYVRLAEGC